MTFISIDDLQTQHEDFHERLLKVVQEVSAYEVTLEEDPTLPHLGNRYLQGALAQCRAYLNRVHHYQMIVRRLEKHLTLAVRHHELDLDLKTSALLADDPMVKRQPAIEDRKALAAANLEQEHKTLSQLRLQLLDVQE